MPYADIRDYLAALETKGLLRHVKVEVDKDWELSCVSRMMYLHLQEKDRYAIVFDKVKGYDIPVAVAVLGASREVYATGLETTVDNIYEKWLHALLNPVKPKTVSEGPCKDNILKGKDVDLNKFPIPIWTPDKDVAPYITSPYVITKDLETGVQNVGTYRLQIKERNKTGISLNPQQDIGIHYAKYEREGKPMPIAIAIGTDPTIGMVSVTKIPTGVDEFTIAGGLRGEPVELIKCETSDLKVPATAEIIVEGEVPPYVREPEGPFGEFAGFVGPERKRAVVNVKCITHRNNPIYQAFISQKPPSESSTIKGTGFEALIYKHLVHDLKIPGVLGIHIPDYSAAVGQVVIKMVPQYPGHAKHVLLAAASTRRGVGKIIIAVDEDVDIRNPNDVNLALSFRMQPDRDVTIIPRTPSLPGDPSTAPGSALMETEEEHLIGSIMLIDATRKWTFPDVSLPSEEYLDKVRKTWGKYGLPRL